MSQADETKRNDPEIRQKYATLILEHAELMAQALPHIKALDDIGGFAGISPKMNRLINQLKAEINPGSIEEVRRLAQNPTYVGNCAAFDLLLVLEDRP